MLIERLIPIFVHNTILRVNRGKVLTQDELLRVSGKQRPLVGVKRALQNMRELWVLAEEIGKSFLCSGRVIGADQVVLHLIWRANVGYAKLPSISFTKPDNEGSHLTIGHRVGDIIACHEAVDQTVLP